MPFKIVRNDITRMQADAIVNTANPEPIVGGGTDTAIYEAAGREQLLRVRQKIGRIGRGEAVITPAFDLDARIIIHTVGPVWNGGGSGEQEVLRSCYRNSLRLALEQGCESIAFPLISTGVYGFPKDLALRTVLDTVSSFLSEHDMMIYLVVFDKKATRLSENIFGEIEQEIDDELVSRRRDWEYREDFRRGLARGNRRFKASTPNVADEAVSDREDMIGSGYSETYFESEEIRCESICEEDDSPIGAAPEEFGGFRYEAFDDDELCSYIESEAPVEPSLPKAAAPAKATKKRSLEDLILHAKPETFQQMLLRLIEERGMTNAQAYKKANQSKQLFSKIKKNVYYQPDKKTVFAFALALELNLDEAKDLLASAGYAFAPGNDFDIAIRYFIENQQYTIYEIEIVLYDLGLDSLCSYA